MSANNPAMPNSHTTHPEKHLRRWPLTQAARAIASGGVIAYPTEAVYGLGCDPDNAAAVLRLLALKQRSIKKGLILIAANLDQLLPYIKTPDTALRQRLTTATPRPITWLVPARADTPPWLCGDHDTLAIRITQHPIARALCQISNGALISTSANRHGQRPARSVLRVRQQFSGELDYILTGTTDPHARPSEIREALNERIIRLG